MPRPIWKGSISFGLVSIPVGLYSAENTEDLSFHMLDRRNLAPVRYKRVNEETGKEVPWDDIVKGYEYEKGKYVIMSDEDFQRANPEATQSVDILGFVDRDEIDVMFFDKPYYLAPMKRGEKGYALLREALRRTGKAGVATVVIRNKQHLATLIVEDQLLVLVLLRYAHEIRQPTDLDIPEDEPKKAGVNEKEAEMAVRLIQGMAEEWDPSQYKDEYRDDLMALIDKRIETGQTERAADAEKPPEKKSAQVVDVMELLKRSLEEKAKPKPKAAAAKEPERRGAARPAFSAASTKKRPKPAAKGRKSA